MVIYQHDGESDKGWYVGPWNSELPISLGYAKFGIDEPHLHRRITEIYLIANGEAIVRVGEREITVATGDVLVLEPGEPHTFLRSTESYFHFVLHLPGLSGEEAQEEKSSVERSQLGL